jgi:hypothetical protein
MDLVGAALGSPKSPASALGGAASPKSGGGAASPKIGGGAASPKSGASAASPKSGGGVVSPLAVSGKSAKPSAPEVDEEEAFATLLRKGSQMMRRGSLDSIQQEVDMARRSQRDIAKGIRDARKASEEADFVIDNCLRRLTVANTSVTKQIARVSKAKETNFAPSTAEFTHWDRLRVHTVSIMDKSRRTKLQHDVEETKQLLESLQHGEPARRIML